MKEVDKMRKTFEYKHKELKKINIGENYACYFFQLPLVPFAIAIDKISKALYNSMKWDTNKANKVLDKALLKTVEYSKEKDSYYYCCEWRVYFSDYAPLYLKPWSKKFQNEIFYYLINEYNNPNYIKTIDIDGYNTWINFKKVLTNQ